MKKSVSALLFIAFLSGCSSVAVDTSGVQKAQAVKSGFIIKRAVDDIKVAGSKKTIKNKTRVIVPFFRLNFVVSDKYRNTIGNYKGSTSSRVNSELSGVNGATYQQIAEEMYTNFIEELKRTGYEVLPNETLDSNAKYAGLARKYPVIKNDVVQATPQGLPFPGTFMDPAVKISKGLDALLLKVDLNVDFLVINKNESRFNITKDSSHVDVTQGVNVLGTVTVYANQKVTTLTLQQPVTSDRPFGIVLDETSAMSRANDVMVAASGWFNGQGLANKRQTTRSFNVDARDQDYRLAAGDALVQANRKVAVTLQGLAG